MVLRRNGQGVSRLDANSDMHFTMRLEKPWKTDSGQIMEAGVAPHEPPRGRIRRQAARIAKNNPIPAR